MPKPGALALSSDSTPDVLLDPLLESQALVRLLPDWALPTRAIYVVRRSDVRPSAKVRSFVDFVKAALG